MGAVAQLRFWTRSLGFLSCLILFDVWGSFKVFPEMYTREESVWIEVYAGGNATRSAVSEGGASTASKPEPTFSACLLVMDDNHRLPEWLAYHYHAVNLRYVVVAVDPHSTTSPSVVLERWRTRMEYEVWNDVDYRNETDRRLDSDGPGEKRVRHKKRQSDFYAACARHLQKKQRGWTLFIDSDEYIAVNPLAHNDPGVQSKPGGLVSLLTADDVPCRAVPRTLYSSIESSDEEIRAGVPVGFDPHRLETLRWRHRAKDRDDTDGLGKSVMQVNRMSEADFADGGNAHRPLKSICPHPFHKYTMSVGIHHYLGSWEAYSFRDDARKGTLRSREQWERRATMDAGGADDIMRPWLAGFVESVGNDVALELLRDAGLPIDHRKDRFEEKEWKSSVKLTDNNRPVMNRQRMQRRRGVMK